MSTHGKNNAQTQYIVTIFKYMFHIVEWGNRKAEERRQSEAIARWAYKQRKASFSLV
jgi:hypothetical protein